MMRPGAGAIRAPRNRCGEIEAGESAPCSDEGVGDRPIHLVQSGGEVDVLGDLHILGQSLDCYAIVDERRLDLDAVEPRRLELRLVVHVDERTRHATAPKY